MSYRQLLTDNMYIATAFRSLRDDKDFSDVTLACEDGEQVEALPIFLVHFIF